MRELNKFSEAITAAVGINCNPNYLSKPQLGRYFAEECSIDDIPIKVKELFTKTRTIIGFEE